MSCESLRVKFPAANSNYNMLLNMTQKGETSVLNQVTKAALEMVMSQLCFLINLSCQYVSGGSSHSSKLNRYL